MNPPVSLPECCFWGPFSHLSSGARGVAIEVSSVGGQLRVQSPTLLVSALEPDSEQASVSPSGKATLVLSGEFELPAWTLRV